MFTIQMGLKSVDFEVFGRVQGVFFRMHTQRKANELDLKGWVMNTAKGSVLGSLEGEPAKIEKMKVWLKEVGSPSSEIARAEFRNERDINEYSIDRFVIRK